MRNDCFNHAVHAVAVIRQAAQAKTAAAEDKYSEQQQAGVRCIAGKPCKDKG